MSKRDKLEQLFAVARRHGWGRTWDERGLVVMWRQNMRTLRTYLARLDPKKPGWVQA